MQLPSSGWRGFKQNWKADLKAGFVVSLVALPISIALALASGAPALAGLITAVVGGLVVAHLGGSFVTITGPGNGLAVATLAAITAMGGDNLLQGYYMALGAIVVSGLLLFLLGYIKMGVLADLFPTSAVQGMLAAIGIIILAKQSHVMIGNLHPSSSEPLPLLWEFTSSLELLIWSHQGIWRAAALGLGSLLLMILYSKIKWTWVHAIPAPLWVVIIAIAVQMGGTRLTGQSFFPSELLVSIPADWMSSWRAPDFSGIATVPFWSAVLSLTFISSIESLLSIKGIDRLDPHKRKSNVNKDLRALGLATALSGLLGGLSVVAVIARSSVNVNNGAQTRSANFFHGLLILVFVLFFRSLLTQIPLPALAAILVFTGYKLLNPAQFRHIAAIGLEQLFLFFFTLVATLLYGLILGILLGMLATLVVQMLLTGATSEILRFFYRPNTLLFEEEENKYILNVNYFSNFLNYPKLKSKLDSVPPTSNLIADFSNTLFVDHTVMEHLAGYEELFHQKGGELEVVGLESFAPSATHPLGVQSRTKKPLTPASKALHSSGLKLQSLSRKQEKLSQFAVLAGFEFTPWPDHSWDAQLNRFEYFKNRRIDHTNNLLQSKTHELIAIEVSTHSGEFIVRDSQQLACAVLRVPNALPTFVLDKERILERLAPFASAQEIEVGDVKFDQRYRIRGRSEKEIKAFLTPECIEFLMNQPAFHMESNGQELLIFHKERVASVAEFKLMVNFASRWADLMAEQQVH